MKMYMKRSLYEWLKEYRIKYLHEMKAIFLNSNDSSFEKKFSYYDKIRINHATKRERLNITKPKLNYIDSDIVNTSLTKNW